MTKDDTQNSDKYLSIIDEIESVRAQNNINWMDILRLAFLHAPEDARQVVRKINREDHKVAALLSKLGES